VPDGSTVTLNVTAVGGEPLIISGISTHECPCRCDQHRPGLQNVTTNQSGLYSVVVSNAFGTVSSTGAVLTVFPFEAPPNVSLLSPTNAAVFALGEPILLEASASDPDGSVVQVEFFADAAALGSAAAAPFRFEWLDANSGVHTLLAVATDNEGARATSALAQITVNFRPTAPASLLEARSGSSWTMGLTRARAGARLALTITHGRAVRLNSATVTAMKPRSLLQGRPPTGSSPPTSGEHSH
jgi:hypothetical protein